MKRSEMLKILEEEINNRQYQDYQFCVETINEILTALEKAGMNTPEREYYKEYDFGEGPEKCFVSEFTWEPECEDPKP